MAYKISKEDMIKELQLGKSLRQIGREYNISKSMMQYISKKYELESDWSKKNNMRRADERFNKVDSKEIAYIIGFLTGDGHICKKDYVYISQCLKDKNVIEWMANYLGVKPTYSYKFDKKKRKFPHVSFSCKIKYIDKYLGSGLKPDRHYPIVPKEFEQYLLRGLFEADGSIIGGERHDRQNRKRFWWRFCINHHQKCLEGVQKFLYKRLNISSIVKKRAKEESYILEVNNADDVKKIMDYMYADTEFMPFPRKYAKYIAMRLESDKFMERKKNPF